MTEQLETCFVRPVEVVEHEKETVVGGRQRQQVHHCPK